MEGIHQSLCTVWSNGLFWWQGPILGILATKIVQEQRDFHLHLAFRLLELCQCQTPNFRIHLAKAASLLKTAADFIFVRVFDTSSKANKKSTSNTQPTRSQLQVPGPHLCSWARVGLANQSLQVFVAQVHHLFEDLPNLTLVTNNSNVVQLSFYHWISQTCMSIHICNPQITWLCNMTDLFLEAYSPKTWNLKWCFPKSNLLYQGFTLRLHVSFRGAVSKSVKHQTSARMDGYLAEVFQSKIAQIRRAHTQVSTMPRYQKKNIRSVAWRHVATANVVVNSLLKHSKNTKCPPMITGSSNQGGQWQNTSVKGLKQIY